MGARLSCDLKFVTFDSIYVQKRKKPILGATTGNKQCVFTIRGKINSL